MAIELGSITPLDPRGFSPLRCDLASHCDVSAEHKLEKVVRLKDNPGITIDAEKLAAMLEGVAKPTEHAATVPNGPAIETPEVITPARRRWESAVSHAVAIVGKLTRTEGPDVAGHSGTILFDGLRDPQRRERTIQKVEVLYESVSATRR